MTIRIGVALARDAVRAVAVRRDRIVWAAEAPLEPEATPSVVIDSLLKEAPVRRLPRPTLSAAIGPHASQLRLVAGLPDAQDPHVLAAVIRENAGSFFLKNGVPLITTGVSPVSAGVALAGAIDEPAVKAVREACRARGWRLRLIAPTPLALMRALADSSFSWTDGRVVLELTASNHAIESIHIRPACAAEPVTAAQTVPALAALGEQAVRYADAYGAVVLEAPQALALDAFAAGAWTPREARRRLLFPAAAVVTGIVSFALSPLAAVRAAARSQARLSSVGPTQWHAVESATLQLDRVTAILEEMRGLSEARSPTTPVLGLLARALPEGSVLVSLELGDDQGQIVAMTSNPAAVLGAVQRLPGARSVELVGPLRREAVTAREVQRVTVRWHRGRP